ncbi:MAG: phosphatidylserine decarboxylase family protein [Bacteroidetes bacterium]|nr:phosphatidylserine decarboxylase family protein [Bacteroidota bacterium]MBS1683524.1 phosphatidylserine decarboxylase family protein [Bacteroidota bacterium]
MSIHREGHGIIIVTGLIAVAINLPLAIITKSTFLAVMVALLSTVVILAFISFFRIPHRDFRLENNKIIAPADGRVVVIEQVEEGEYFKDKRIQVSIFMSPANVHVNRSPVSGVVTYQKYHPGQYLVAWHPKSSEKNERNTVVIEHQDGIEILIRQIAGKLARKIRYYVSEGDSIDQANEFGFIKFGSRVDLFLPLGTVIDVDLKQKVKGGITVIGTLPDKA